ncbi:DNA-directed RNA polymerase [Aquirufa nivalisilvae]|uniref:DNA-directed RNA polymerase n=1 Tax=Aquirufa nivalisilvae TaxID=2516557 RepID=A0A2S2DYS9_9BACT|nr:pitrilysin family protein [Aquirufa nivalisilvae]AWL10190.1 DNA-directed RNA polymerase [Aquirufa nivalisilvae]
MLDRSTPPPAFPIELVKFPTVDVFHLSNGIPVYSINLGEQPVFKLEIISPAGSKSGSKAGLANMVANLMRRGTLAHSAQAIHEAFDFLGAFWDIQANLDNANFSVYGLNKHFEALIPWVAELLKEATFSQEEYEKEIAIEIQKNKLNWQKTSFAASQLFRGQIFGNHAYGRYSSPESLADLSRNDLFDFYTSTWANVKPIIFLSGRISDQELQLLDRFIGQLRFDQPWPGKLPIVTPQAVQIEHDRRDGALQTSIRVGKLAIGRNHPDYFQFSILNTILGGYFGSRLQNNIREDKGFTYGISSSIVPLQESSYWVTGTDVNGENSEQTLEEIKKEIRILQNELVSEEELELVKNYLMGSFTGELTQAFDIAEKIKVIQLENLAPDFYDQFQTQIIQCQAQELREIANQYLNLDELHVVMVGA